MAIHFGISGSSPFLGRDLHCLAAIATKSRPSARVTQLTPSALALSASSAPELTSRTMTLTATSPPTHPIANAGPLVRALGVPSMRMTAMIGTGLSATPTADGSRSPIAWVSTLRSSQVRRSPATMANAAVDVRAGAATVRPGVEARDLHSWG